ncbi:RNA-directed DNA polymerase, partial [Vibrio cholerae]|nr:RNA-directed DNA polymerase [Vibrio cholerae]
MENIFNYLLSSPNVVDFSNESKKTKQPKLPQDILHDVLLYGPKMYKVYTIPKKNGGKRVIAHPSRGLKVVQRDLVVFLEKILPVHNSAYAYIKNRSIKDNAHYHSKNRYHLKMDLSNFFNSIDTELFFTQLDTNGVTFNSDEMYLLQRSLFWSPTKSEIGKLITSVGAPSSPLISNFIMNTYDFMISDICKS